MFFFHSDIRAHEQQSPKLLVSLNAPLQTDTFPVFDEFFGIVEIYI